MPSSPPLPRPLLPALAALVLGCGAGEPPPFRTATLDSAGVRIVQRSVATWPEGRAWAVDARPEVMIGGVAEDSAAALFRTTGALRLDDGRIVVANGGTRELRFFDPAGRPLHGVGTEGEGPGEFRAVSGIARYRGDSLAVYDNALLRVSIFDNQGRYGRSFSVADAAGSSRLELVGALADGGVAFTIFEWQETRKPTRMPGAVLRWTANGEGYDSIAPFPGPEVYWRSLPGYPPGPRMRPYGPISSAVVDENRIHVAPGDPYEIRTYAPHRGLTRIFRMHHVFVPVTPELRERHARERIETSPNERVREVRTYEHERGRIEYPDRLPAYGSVLADGDGHLWIEEYAAAASDVARFTVIAPDAEPLGTITLPPGLRPLDIGADYLLARTVDSLDVEAVQLHRLRR